MKLKKLIKTVFFCATAIFVSLTVAPTSYAASAKLNWNAVTEMTDSTPATIEKYTIYYRVDAGELIALDVSGDLVEYSFTDLSNGVWDFAITACATGACSELTDYASINLNSTESAKPNRVQGLTVTEIVEDPEPPQTGVIFIEDFENALPHTTVEGVEVNANPYGNAVTSSDSFAGWDSQSLKINSGSWASLNVYGQDGNLGRTDEGAVELDVYFTSASFRKNSMLMQIDGKSNNSSIDNNDGINIKFQKTDSDTNDGVRVGMGAAVANGYDTLVNVTSGIDLQPGKYTFLLKWSRSKSIDGEFSLTLDINGERYIQTSDDLPVSSWEYWHHLSIGNDTNYGYYSDTYIDNFKVY